MARVLEMVQLVGHWPVGPDGALRDRWQRSQGGEGKITKEGHFVCRLPNRRVLTVPCFQVRGWIEHEPAPDPSEPPKPPPKPRSRPRARRKGAGKAS